MRTALEHWGRGILDVLREARPDMPASLSDRATDVWEPLVAIADVAGQAWPSRGREAARALSGRFEDADLRVELLRDIFQIAREMSHPTIVASQDLIAQLTAITDRPWATYARGKPLTPHGLARLLDPLGIHPISTGKLRGYMVEGFGDAFARYLPREVSERQDAAESKVAGADSFVTGVSLAGQSVSNAGPNSPADLTLRHFEPGESDEGRTF
jgi:hypothetical protein